MTYHNAQKYILNSPDEFENETMGANLRKLWAELGNPQRNLKYLRLAGSNGKTVCAEMLISAYKNSEYKTGCLTTTLRRDLRDNISINGSPISFENMAAFVEKIYKTVTEFNKDAHEGSLFVLTKQEILLTAALLAFREADCKLCIIESDHTHADPTVFLPPPFAVAICGTIPSDSKDEIQRIRSYICHGIQEIVSAPQDQNAYKVIFDACVSVSCRLTIPTRSELDIGRLTLSGSDFSYKGLDYHINLCGKFQITNAIFVLEIIDRLSQKGYALSQKQIYEGLKNTRIPSKFEILSVMPTIIADSTHSDIAIGTVCDSMSEFRDIIGEKIRLCLPSGPIVDRYIDVLTEQGYDIEQIIIAEYYSPSETAVDPSNIRTTRCKKIREAVSACLNGLCGDEILLISGPHSFTNEIRYELLTRLGF